jgi:hypothetical protein
MLRGSGDIEIYEAFMPRDLSIRCESIRFVDESLFKCPLKTRVCLGCGAHREEPLRRNIKPRWHMNGSIEETL